MLPASLLFALILSQDSEFIYDRASFPSCHASTIVETSPGEFLSAWFGGSDEGKPDVAIWGARRGKDGHWSDPVELAREPGIATYNPVLFYSADKTLWLYYKFGPSPSSWTGARLSSVDRGQTWSEIEHLPAGLLGPIKDKPLILSDGTILAGTSVESYHAWSAWVERSTDNGRTWTKHGPVTVPGQPHGIIQPSLVRLKDGRVRMYVRATQRIAHICYADSSDGGKTWTSAQPTELLNPNSGIDAVGLSDGRIVIVYNNTNKGRSPLNVAISRDGDHWNQFLALETEPGEFSYPAVIQAANGDVHITYTWNRKKIKHVTLSLDSIPK